MKEQDNSLKKKTLALFLSLFIGVCFVGDTSSEAAHTGEKNISLSHLAPQKKALLLRKKHQHLLLPEALHLKAKKNIYPQRAFNAQNSKTFVPGGKSRNAQLRAAIYGQTLPSESLEQSEIQLGTALSQETSFYITASFKKIEEHPDSKIWAQNHLPKKSVIMPGVGFDWHPPEKLKVGSYQWRLPHKLSLSGELRADVLKKENVTNSLTTLPSRLRFNAVLFKVHYTLGAQKK